MNSDTAAFLTSSYDAYQVLLEHCGRPVCCFGSFHNSFALAADVAVGDRANALILNFPYVAVSSSWLKLGPRGGLHGRAFGHHFLLHAEVFWALN